MNCQVEIESHYKYVEKQIKNKIFGVFLYGSQNYGLNTEQSDIDSICVVFPTAEEFIYGKETPSYTFKINDKNETRIWDIRKFFYLLEKGGFNCLELLFTEFYCINHEFINEYEELNVLREKIARFNTVSTFTSYLGMINRLCKNATNRIDTSDDLKDYARMHYLYNSMILYSNPDNSFKSVLKHDRTFNEYYLMIRNMDFNTIRDKFIDSVNDLNNKAKEFYDKTLPSIVMNRFEDEHKKFNEIQCDLLYKIMNYYIESRKENDTINNIKENDDEVKKEKAEEFTPYDYFNETMNV